MTVDELIEWLESAKRTSEESGQQIGEYPIMCRSSTVINGEDMYLLPDPRVDHGLSTVIL